MAGVLQPTITNAGQAMMSAPSAAAQQALLAPYTALADVIQIASSPSSGATVVSNPGSTVLLIDNPGLLLALTVTLPQNPVNGQRFTICANAAITALTVNGGTVRGVLSGLSISGYARYIYSTALGVWFRAG